MSLLVEEPGLFITVQDLGRVGHQRIGVPPSGALDPLALRMGNAVLGQGQGVAGLEMCRVGGCFKVAMESLRFCIAGADVPVTLDGLEIAPWRSVTAPAGAEPADRPHPRRRGLSVRAGRL